MASIGAIGSRLNLHSAIHTRQSPVTLRLLFDELSGTFAFWRAGGVLASTRGPARYA
jgi:hypothetical protein